VREKKILIIDDDEQDRKGMALALKRQGYSQVEVAASGEEGVALAQSSRPDVVVVDVVLKSRDGFDVCKAIKSSDHLAAKVIVITGHLEAIDVVKARGSGADEILQKTAGFDDIHKTIQQLMTSL